MRFLLFIYFVGLFHVYFSQESLNRNSKTFIVSDIALQRMDAFLNVGIKKRVNYFELGMSAGIGIEKTFFQQRLSKHLEFYSFFNLIQKEINRKNGIVFGPGILFSGTSFKIYNPFRYGDVFLAYQLCYGQKIKLIHQAGYGLMFESFHGNQGAVLNRTYNYYLKIGVSYALNF